MSKQTDNINDSITEKLEVDKLMKGTTTKSSRMNPEKVAVGVLIAICVVCGVVMLAGIESGNSQIAGIEESQQQ